MPATKEKPKRSNTLYVFVEELKYSLAYSNDIKDLKSTMGLGKKSFFFYFAGKSKNETQSTILLIANEMKKEGRRPTIKVFSDGSITKSASTKLITEWNKLITESVKKTPTDNVKKKTARKEMLK